MSSRPRSQKNQCNTGPRTAGEINPAKTHNSSGRKAYADGNKAYTDGNKAYADLNKAVYTTRVAPSWLEEKTWTDRRKDG